VVYKNAVGLDAAPQKITSFCDSVPSNNNESRPDNTHSLGYQALLPLLVGNP